VNNGDEHIIYFIFVGFPPPASQSKEGFGVSIFFFGFY
jgi:hypothetical protein